jgi:hypothetical protein
MEAVRRIKHVSEGHCQFQTQYFLTALLWSFLHTVNGISSSALCELVGYSVSWCLEREQIACTSPWMQLCLFVGWLVGKMI